MFFQTTFEKKLVAETSKELELLLPQRKIRCATTSLFGVGGSGRRPLELRRSNRNRGDPSGPLKNTENPSNSSFHTLSKKFERPAATSADPENEFATQ